MKKKFNEIRHVLEEHLSSINENTTEIQSMFDYLQEMETKMDTLSRRLDTLQLTIGEPIEKPFVEPLDQMEKNVFLLFYTENVPLSYQDISLRVRIPLSIVPECVSTLTKKGVPLLRTRIDNQIFFKLSPSFKEVQAKENVINLSLSSFIE